MPATYEPIATTTLGSAAASYTFSSIPATYTDLILVFNGTQTSNGNTIYVRCNGDTATNYSCTVLYGTGSVTGSTRASNLSDGLQLAGYIGGLSSTSPAVAYINIMNYSNTTTYKSSISRSSLASSDTQTAASLWRSTAAINSLTVRIDANTIAAGTTLTLYGIKAA
jgi:hypothetical protein